ncbi:MAG: DUF5011 domain-containing protein [Pseudomonadales bacterium]
MLKKEFFFMLLIRFFGLALLSSLSMFATNSRADTAAPVISLIGFENVWHALGTSYTDLGATAIDDIDGDISAKITASGSVNANVLGTYTIVYSVSDAAGNKAEQVTRTVTVTEDLQVISLSSADEIIDAGGQQAYELIYRTEPLVRQTSGLALVFYHDSSKTALTFELAEGMLAVGCDVQFRGPQTAPDSNDTDGNLATDTVFAMGLISEIEGEFPCNFKGEATLGALTVSAVNPDYIGPIDLNLQIAASPGFAAVKKLPSLSFLGDTDGDGVRDDLDAFSLDPNETLDSDSDGVGDNADADDDGDGVEDTQDAFPLDWSESFDTDSDGIGDNADADDDGDGQVDEQEVTCGSDPLVSGSISPDFDLDSVPDCIDDDDDGDSVVDSLDAFPLNFNESEDSDGDGVGDNSDAFPNDPLESLDTDLDRIGNNSDLDDDNDGFTDEEELVDGTDPLSRFSCSSGCFSFDVDESLKAQPLTDGLLVIRHLFGFIGDALTSGAVSSDASRDASDVIASYLNDADSQLDIDGDSESKPLTDGLLLIRYLFGFSGDSLISGAIGTDATRNTAEAVEAYIKERIPAN